MKKLILFLIVALLPVLAMEAYPYRRGWGYRGWRRGYPYRRFWGGPYYGYPYYRPGFSIGFGIGL